MAACDFCGRGRGEVELLVRAARGGLPAAICAECIDDIAATLAAARAAAADPARNGSETGRNAAD